ncbi:16351_t:CDS:2 [Entrophospora sp. SA101]|nr:16351_t:CDS:2 [Entrophospora sp. SA101]
MRNQLDDQIIQVLQGAALSAATKSSPSPQKKSSQSHKRALSTEIVYKLLGNITSESVAVINLAVYRPVVESIMSTASPLAK